MVSFQPALITRLKQRTERVLVNLAPLALWLRLLSGCALRKVLSLLSIDLGLAAEQVSSLWLGTVRLHDELVPEDHDEVEWDTEVGRDEVLVVPLSVALLWNEVIVTLEECNQAAEDEGDIRSPDASWCDESKLVVGDTLGLASADEVDVGNQDGDPGKDTKDGDQVDEVLEDGLGGAVDVEESKKTEEGRASQSVDRDTTAIGTAEDTWSVTLNSETVKSTGGNVEIGVGGGEDEDQDTGVEDGWESVDTGNLDGDDEWRSSSGWTGRSSLVGLNKLWVVVWENHAQEEDQHNVKKQNTVEGKLDGAWDDLAWVLSLTDGDTDKLDTKVSEDSGGKSRPECEEATLGRRLGSDVGCESTWVAPVSETLWILIWASTAGKNQRNHDETENDDDLDGGQPELKFTKELDTKVVDEDDGDHGDRNEDTRVELFWVGPVLEDEGESSKLIRSDDNVLIKLG